MQIRIDKKYLWFPVDMSQEEIKVNIYAADSQIHEINIHLGKGHCDFYGALKVEEYLGQTLELRSAAGEELLLGVRQEETRPANDYPYRPKLHYTPSYGWVNDPNGLVYHNGVWHLFHQYNPYGTMWQNMSWGHAVSRDLFHWEEKDVALYPDEYGTAYSGCALLDKENRAGFGKDAILFYYTAAGGRSEQSARLGNPFTQRLLWSDGNGETLHPADKCVVPWIADENRDPKVFRHEASDGFIMVLYLEKNEFAILRSTDLLHWEETQRLDIPEMWECPLLMELPVEGTKEKKWVFWSADGYYLVGSFDGWRFQPESDRMMAYISRRAYAAQNYENTGDRTVMVSWLRLDNGLGNYRGAMGLPMTLTLKKTQAGLRLAFDTVEELEGLRGQWEPLESRTPGTEAYRASRELKEQAGELYVSWEKGSRGLAEIRVGETAIRLDLGTGILTVDTKRLQSLETEIKGSFDPESEMNLRVIIDQEAIELLGADGLLCGTVETEENVLAKTVGFCSEAPVKECRFSQFYTA